MTNDNYLEGNIENKNENIVDGDNYMKQNQRECDISSMKINKITQVKQIKVRKLEGKNSNMNNNMDSDSNNVTKLSKKSVEVKSFVSQKVWKN